MDPCSLPESPLTASIDIKIPDSSQTLVSVTLPVAGVSELALVDSRLLAHCVLPSKVQVEIEPLKGLVSPATDVVFEDIVAARLSLQAWFQDDLGYRNHKLRHIIARSSTVDESSSCRKSFAIQKPVLRFHTDSIHTKFTNIWLPLAVTDYFLGFLHHPLCGIVTAGKLQLHAGGGTSVLSKQKLFLSSCSIVYFPNALDFGHAIVFCSGGSAGLLHGSFRIRGTTPGHRESVEFRCQRYNNEGWVYGDQ